MASIIALQGNCISDCILNGTGVITNWGDFLTLNGFNTWTPDLLNGQIIQIPDNADINTVIVADLKTYPANNGTNNDVFAQIDTIFGILAGATVGFVPNFATPVIDTNTYYKVREGECFVDVVMNSSGDILNWDVILQANNFEDWNPTLYNGQIITIPPSINLNSNNFRGLNTYPANNNSVPDVYIQIDAIFALMINPIPSDWILNNPDGVWNDIAHFWRDGASWLDN